MLGLSFNQRQILEVLQVFDGCGAKDGHQIVKEADLCFKRRFGYEQLRSCLKGMEGRGLVERHGTRPMRWTITAEGRRALQQVPRVAA